MKTVSKSGWKNPSRMSAVLSLFLFACGAARTDTDSLMTYYNNVSRDMTPGQASLTRAERFVRRW